MASTIFEDLAGGSCEPTRTPDLSIMARRGGDLRSALVYDSSCPCTSAIGML